MGLKDRERAATISAFMDRLIGDGGFEALRQVENFRCCDANFELRGKPVAGVLAIYGLGLVWATRKHLALHRGVWGPSDFSIATNAIATVDMSPPKGQYGWTPENFHAVRLHAEGGAWLQVTTTKGQILPFSRLSDPFSVAIRLEALVAARDTV